MSKSISASLGIYVVVSALVLARGLGETDLAVARAAYAVDSPWLEWVSRAVAFLFAIEGSLLYGIVVGYVLLRRELGIWALAPLAFVVPVALEVVFKYGLPQPGPPGELQRVFHYPLATLHTPGSFPSGHAIRSTFFCVFACVVLSPQLGPLGSAALRAFTVAMILIFALSRVYLGEHWFSDVVGGAALGVATALAVAPSVAHRLRPALGRD